MPQPSKEESEDFLTALMDSMAPCARMTLTIICSGICISPWSCQKNHVFATRPVGLRKKGPLAAVAFAMPPCQVSSGSNGTPQSRVDFQPKFQNLASPPIFLYFCFNILSYGMGQRFHVDHLQHSSPFPAHKSYTWGLLVIIPILHILIPYCP